MIKLDSLSRWIALPKGQVLTLHGNKSERRIRINVNSPRRICLYLVNDDGELVFLAAPVGRDVIEFAQGGDVRIATEDDDVSVYTSEREPTFTVIEDAEIFTTIMTRAARNPDLEYLMAKQQANIERRFQMLEAEANQRAEAAYHAGKQAAVTPSAPAPEPAPVEPEQDAGPVSPVASDGEAEPS